MTSEPIYTLADLDRWSFEGTALAVLGHPIKHSISPQMHNAALAKMAERNSKFETWKYFRFEIKPENLPAALGKFYALGFKGLNLTVPHKVIAFGLPEISVTPASTLIGAVNTLLRTQHGWIGHNTDGYGLATGVREAPLGCDLRNSHIILLGAGGAARGAAVECLSKPCASLWIANRTASNRDTLITQLKPLVKEIPLYGFDPASPPATIPANALVINATSAGLRSDDPLPIDLALLPRPKGVYDMIYNPPETRLLAQARALGIPAANGLSMLVHQGARALEIWSGAVVPVDAMRTAVHSAMRLSA